MSLPVSPPTERRPSSTPSASAEPATIPSIQHDNAHQAWIWKALVTGIQSCFGFLVGIVCQIPCPLSRIFASFFISSDANLSNSPNDNPGADRGDEQSPNVPIAAPLVHGTEDEQPSGEPLRGPPVATIARRPKKESVSDGDDPADGTFPSPTKDDSQLSDSESADEYLYEPLTRADRETVDQYHEQVISRHMILRPVGLPDGVIGRNRTYRPWTGKRAVQG